MSSPPRIRIRNLKKSFGNHKVLDGVNLDVEIGTSMVIIGGSGTGKSVLLRCILGLVEPDDGTIEIDGLDLLNASQKKQKEIRKNMGMLFQNAALFDSMTILENILFGLEAKSPHKRSKNDLKKEALSLLGRVGLKEDVAPLSPAELSGGMQKRVGLARAIAGHPDILFFDEPTTGLDPIMGSVIDMLIVECVKDLGSTAITITHDMASARRIGTDAAMLYEGKIIWQDKADALMTSSHPLVKQFTHGLQEPLK